MYPAILIAILISVGGASVAAETAVPGDALYPVKTQITEPIRGQMALSTEAKARWQAELAERRLAEARMLATRGVLNAESAAGLSERFSASAAASLTLAQTLVTDNQMEAATEIAADIEASTRAYAALLENRAIEIGGFLRGALSPSVETSGTSETQMEASSGTATESGIEIDAEADASGTTVIDGSSVEVDSSLKGGVSL